VDEDWIKHWVHVKNLDEKKNLNMGKEIFDPQTKDSV
jgi:hypothetical protein